MYRNKNIKFLGGKQFKAMSGVILLNRYDLALYVSQIEQNLAQEVKLQIENSAINELQQRSKDHIRRVEIPELNQIVRKLTLIDRVERVIDPVL